MSVASKFTQTCPGNSFATGFTGSHTADVIDTLSIVCSDGTVLPAQGTKQTGSIAFTTIPCANGLSGAETSIPNDLSYNPAQKDVTVLTSLKDVCNGKNGTRILNPLENSSTTFISRGCAETEAINGVQVEDNRPMFTCSRKSTGFGTGSGTAKTSGAGTGAGISSGTGTGTGTGTKTNNWQWVISASCSLVMVFFFIVFLLMRRKR